MSTSPYRRRHRAVAALALLLSLAHGWVALLRAWPGGLLPLLVSYALWCMALDLLRGAPR